MTLAKLQIALAGYANVGKSVIFNYLTGLHQHIGNWPGKTIERAEGSLHYSGYDIDVIDLPGIYSLSTYSIEEIITREYIFTGEPHFIINVLDATSLETNLIFTLQLLELEQPVIVALNMFNTAQKKGLQIDVAHLEILLGVAVVPTVATLGKGITELLDRGLTELAKPRQIPLIRYGKEVETCLERIIVALAPYYPPCPKRFLALKLLEKDQELTKWLTQHAPAVCEVVQQCTTTLEEIHGHDAAIVIANERSVAAAQIARAVTIRHAVTEHKCTDWLESLTAHKLLGYPIMLLIFCTVFWGVFGCEEYFGELLHDGVIWLQQLFSSLFVTTPWFTKILWSGIESFSALVELALPVILPFYFLLFVLEDCGYLARVAYLMDNLMHHLGIHGKACMPLILGFGCNVPACLGCRIMETQRERFITGLLTIFVPCGAVTVVVTGLVGKFLGWQAAITLYLANFVLLFMIGKIATWLLPGKPTALIMKMPSYRIPSWRTVMMQTWLHLREFLLIAGPLVVFTGMLIELVVTQRLFSGINQLLAPLTVKWLRLPEVTGVLLIFGILRKELILVMLATLLGGANFGKILSVSQILTLATLSMFYIPCIATIAALKQEFGLKKALGLSLLKVCLAILLGGIVARLF